MAQGLAIGERRYDRRRTPTVLQIEAVECGAAALAMILAAHGRWTPLTELRRLCGVSRDGSRASSMVRAARSLGMEAKGFRLAGERIRQAPTPAIVFVNMNHFMVLEGVRGGRVYLNDPAGGALSLTLEEFQEIYSGIALCFSPRPDFARIGAPPTLIRPLFEWLADAHTAFNFVVLCGLLLAIPGILLPAYTRIFIDQIITDRQSNWFVWLLVALIATLSVQALLQTLRNRCQLALRNRIAIRAMAAFVHRLLRVPLAYFAQRSPGGVGSRADRGERLADHASAELTTIAIEAGCVLFFLITMEFYSQTLTLIVVGTALVVTWLHVFLTRRLREGERRVAIDEVKLGAKTIQGLAQIEGLKASGAEDAFFEVWSGQHARVVNIQQRQGWTEAQLTAIPELCRTVGQIGILLVGGLLVMHGAATIGFLVAFQQLHMNFENSSRQLFAGALKLQKARGTLDQIDDLLDQPEAAEFSPDRPEIDPLTLVTTLGRLRKLDGEIVVRNLTFGYSAFDEPLIRNFSLSMRPGSRVALVGASGSGKSTLGRLISGLVEPWSGEVLIDGQPLSAIPRELLRNSMAVVDQEIAMFHGSIRDNIALWDATMPDERIVQAAKDAMIHDDIVRRATSYAASVEERGRNFSGGQKQRLEIARALVGEPSILILDEATSALDPLVEKAVMDNIRRRGCTCIIIAHRLSTIRDCDEIIVLGHGRIIQRGTHDQMAAVDGTYRRLIEN
jgi:NHLM bacteriocin system ABC transporter peptidase/ATP-binding protein